MNAKSASIFVASVLIVTAGVLFHENALRKAMRFSSDEKAQALHDAPGPVRLGDGDESAFDQLKSAVPNGGDEAASMPADVQRMEISVPGGNAVGAPANSAAVDYDVIVMGAGIAGMKASEDLAAQGKKVLILESEDRIGGRTKTNRETFDRPIDEGAHWFHAFKGHELYQEAIRMGFSPVSDNFDMAYFGALKGRQKEMDNAWGQVENGMERAAEKKEDVPYSQMIDGLYLSPQVKKIMKDIQSQDNLKDSDSLSAMSTFQEADWGGGDAVVIEGLGATVQTYAKRVLAEYADRISLRLSTPVQKVVTGQGRFTVETGHDTFTAYKGVCTLSTSVVAKYGEKLGLPKWKVEAARSRSAGNYKKVVLHFKSDIFAGKTNLDWPYDADPDTLQVTSFYIDHRGPDGMIVAALVGSARADALSKMSDEDAQQDILNVLRRMVGRDTVDSAFVKGSVTHWAEQNSFMGSFVTMEAGGYAKQADVMKPVDNQLFFAGDGYVPVESGRLGTTGGAWDSGRNVAASLKTLMDSEGWRPGTATGKVGGIWSSSYSAGLTQGAQRLRELSPDPETFQPKQRHPETERVEPRQGAE